MAKVDTHRVLPNKEKGGLFLTTASDAKLLEIKTLEGWLWDAACKIRGEVDAPRYKDYILPLIFLKRLSDVFDDEIAKLAEEHGSTDVALELVEADHELVWFYLPESARWEGIMRQSNKLGEYLTDAVRGVARENPKLQGVIDVVDFNATTAGQRVITDEKLKALIDTLNRHRLGLGDVEPDILGRAYEYLLRKFAEGSGQSAGEFYTPREVGVLMGNILDPKEGEEVYDPCLGSGGLIIKTYLRFKEKYGDNTRVKPLHFYGQEVLHSTFAMAKMNAFIHRMEAEIALGDTMNRPAFLTPQGSLRKFDIVVANPMWNQNFDQSVYDGDPYNRFGLGFPPSGSADWGWIQHMFTSLNDNGRMAVVLDTGSVSRGSGNTGSNRERDIRKQFVEQDFVEAVILLPENMFYNTISPGIILILNKKKRNSGEILLVNAADMFEKGRPKNYLTMDSISEIANIYYQWEIQSGRSNLVKVDEILRNDSNLHPSRYVTKDGTNDTLPLEESLLMLKTADEEYKLAESKLNKMLGKLSVLP